MCYECFFFFKQKTAYEMRISDWSSDVCSSDLSARTGEPVATQLHSSPSCTTDAARIAARVPAMSFGYTKLDARHQDARFDVTLAEDISKAFAGLKVELPGLGRAGTAPFDLRVALPVATLRTFLLAQADTVARSDARRAGKECESQCRS